MSQPVLVRTFTADVTEMTAEGFEFSGCSDRSPDHCACSTFTETECAVCDQIIADGQRIQQVTYPTLPWFGTLSMDQVFESQTWHVTCPEPETEES